MLHLYRLQVFLEIFMCFFHFIKKISDDVTFQEIIFIPSEISRDVAPPAVDFHSIRNQWPGNS